MEFNVKHYFLLILVFLCSACSLIPSSAPRFKELTPTSNQTITVDDFAVIKLDLSLINHLSPDRETKLFDNKKNIAQKMNQTLQIGSKIVITVWEPSELGVFASTGLQGSPQKLEVNSDGEIFFPFVGKIPVLHLTLFELSENLEGLLKGKAIEPQIQIQFNDENNVKLTVMGEVNTPGTYSIPSSGYKLLEAIAVAGGAKSPSHESEVVLLRGNEIIKMRMEDILSFPSNNINIIAKDIIHLYYRPKSFSALGAVEDQSKQLFTKENLNLTEALAQAGGLKDELADAGAVFLFRFEPEDKLRGFGVTIPESKYPKGFPTIYTLDFNDPKALFLASSFPMENSDILFVSTATGAEFKKFAEIVLAPFITIKKL